MKSVFALLVVLAVAQAALGTSFLRSRDTRNCPLFLFLYFLCFSKSQQKQNSHYKNNTKILPFTSTPLSFLYGISAVVSESPDVDPDADGKLKCFVVHDSKSALERRRNSSNSNLESISF